MKTASNDRRGTDGYKLAANQKSAIQMNCEKYAIREI